MIKEALQYIVGLNEVKTMILEGRNFTDKKIYPVEEPIIVPLRISSLAGVVQYVKEIAQTEKGWLTDGDAPLVISIKDHCTVEICSSIVSAELNRQKLLLSEFTAPNFRFGEFYDAESFNIKMQSVFLDTEDKEIILKVVGNLKEESVRNVGDDGVSQSVNVKVGIATVAEVKVPNPVKLKPFRTFFEAGQPESLFVFRMREGGKCALFEADGGEWKEAAKQNIFDFLEYELAEEITGKQIVLMR
ncbi:hypothetical protein [Anaerotignum propionicum]|uniref:hypothetical protein n=1 Tax=Anaerotignum propionicum TaxID=28446 RepID=UPI002898A6CE|nr:hypothetical protein [Anaerotignum propionicum]